MATDRYLDLLKQGFMKQGRSQSQRVRKEPPPIVACSDCMNWHRKGQHTADKATRVFNHANNRCQVKGCKNEGTLSTFDGLNVCREHYDKHNHPAGLNFNL